MSSQLGHDLSLWGRFNYRFFWSLLWVITKVWVRFTIVGRENLPATGAYILAPVHRSYLDTPVGGMVTARRQRFLGKESLWRNWFLGGFLTIVGGFPVERGTADRAALRACQDVLERGEPLVMFPEGTRQWGAVVEADKMHDGPAFVAARAGVETTAPANQNNCSSVIRPTSSVSNSGVSCSTVSIRICRKTLVLLSALRAFSFPYFAASRNQ